VRRREERQAAAAAEQAVDDSKTLRCGYCSQAGHNRRTCPVLKVSRMPRSALSQVCRSAIIQRYMKLALMAELVA